MESFKSGLFLIIALALTGLLGYWAVTTLESGSEHVSSQKLKDLQKENKDLAIQVGSLEDKLANSESKLAGLAPQEPAVESQSQVEASAPTTAYKYQSLIDELQELVTDGVSMKQKSVGSRVGTVQKFLNVYNNTSNKIDNDYGPNMVKVVTAFQKAVGLKADGQAGVPTFNKMIDWLKKQT